MKKLNSFTKSLLAATVALLALSSVACKQSPKEPIEEKQTTNLADVLDGKAFNVNYVEYPDFIGVYLKFEKNSNFDNGNYLIADVMGLYCIDYIKVEQKDKTTYSLYCGDYEIINGDINVHIKELNGSYNTTNNSLNFTYEIINKDSSISTITYNNELNTEVTLSKVYNMPYYNSSTKADITKEGLFTYNEKTYDLTKATPIIYNNWTVESESGDSKLIFHIAKDYSRIFCQLDPLSIDASEKPQYSYFDLVTFTNFVNKTLVGYTNSANTIKFVPTSDDKLTGTYIMELDSVIKAGNYVFKKGTKLSQYTGLMYEGEKPTSLSDKNKCTYTISIQSNKTIAIENTSVIKSPIYIIK